MMDPIQSLVYACSDTVGSVDSKMGLYCDDGCGSAFSTHMKLWHVGLEQFCPAEVS